MLNEVVYSLIEESPFIFDPFLPLHSILKIIFFALHRAFSLYNQPTEISYQKVKQFLGNRKSRTSDTREQT